MFVGITLMLLDVTGAPLAEKGVLHPYLAWMAQIQFFPALLSMTTGAALSGAIIVGAIVLITWLLGRVYCSVICPLGVMQDILSWMMGRKWLRRFGKRFGQNRFRFEEEHNWLRWCVLVIFAILCLIPATAAFAHIIAPYSAYGRMVQALVAPYHTPLVVIAVVMFLLVATMACLAGREWCNTICPVGTLLGAISRHSVIRPTMDKALCNHCGKCARNCKAQCIDPKNNTIDTSRCVDCFDCIDNCPQGAIAFKKASPQEASSHENEENNGTTIDQSRRQFLGVLGGLAVAGVASAEKTADGGLAVIEQKKVPARATVLIPAGAKSLRHFAQHCTSCQLCVSACPNEVLRPSTDLKRMLQPEMQYDKGYCPPTCHKCADVCPTSAIHLKDVLEKSSIQIGHAVWVKDNCVVLTDEVSCGNCARHCPTGAIQMVDVDGKQVPAVDTEKCIGCGHCEYVCPSRPFSAIYVEGHEQHRMV